MAAKFLCLCLFCLVLFCGGLGDRDLTSSHEARAAQNAQMILDEGCWLVPRLYDRHLELQKPPLYYWLVAVIGWLRGGHVDAWAVRLPAALAGLGTVLWVFFLAQRCGRARAGFLAALILATFLHFTATARVGRIDMPLTFSVALALGGLYLGVREQRRRWFILSYTALGMGLLLKGPIAVVLPGAVVLAWFADAAFRLAFDSRSPNMERSPQILLRSLLWGIPWTLALALPWYLVANRATDNQIWETFLWYHNVERGFGSERLAAHPIWFYFLRMWIDLLPWSFLLPFALWRHGSARGAVHFGGLAKEESRFALVWFTAILVLLSLLRFKRADYLVPAYPGAALFLALWLDDLLAQCSAGFQRLIQCSFATLLVLTSLGWVVYAQAWEQEDAGANLLARDVRRRTEGMVIFFRAEDHALAFHVGRPLDTILEWENLDIWASQPMPIYFVMSPACAAAWPEHLQRGRLEVIERWTDGLRRPLVLLRNRPPIP